MIQVISVVSSNFKMAEKRAKLARFFGLCWNHPEYSKIAHLSMEISMFNQDNLWDLKAAYGDWFPSFKFLIMFNGVVVGPLVLLAIGGRDSNNPWETVLAWSFLAIALLLLISLGFGLSMFRRETRVPSISPKYV
jgi:hypothetical protein